MGQPRLRAVCHGVPLTVAHLPWQSDPHRSRLKERMRIRVLYQHFMLEEGDTTQALFRVGSCSLVAILVPPRSDKSIGPLTRELDLNIDKSEQLDQEKCFSSCALRSECLSVMSTNEVSDTDAHEDQALRRPTDLLQYKMREMDEVTDVWNQTAPSIPQKKRALSVVSQRKLPAVFGGPARLSASAAFVTATSGEAIRQTCSRAHSPQHHTEQRINLAAASQAEMLTQVTGLHLNKTQSDTHRRPAQELSETNPAARPAVTAEVLCRCHFLAHDRLKGGKNTRAALAHLCRKMQSWCLIAESVKAVPILGTQTPQDGEGCEAKESSEREDLPAQECQERFTQTFRQKLEILCGHAVSGLRLYPSPQPQENSCSPGMLNQRALILPSSSTAERTCTRTYWEQFKGWRGSLVSIIHSHVGLSVKKAKKSLPSRREMAEENSPVTFGKCNQCHYSEVEVGGTGRFPSFPGEKYDEGLPGPGDVERKASSWKLNTKQQNEVLKGKSQRLEAQLNMQQQNEVLKEL
ncbi:hypothetical protein Anapl_03531 [Anas platyrhynchos]|uniref:Uncharacterized protein n=1 Tax=Anas platyrhynchos TaxID=8839 RepID=R0LX77_ANAPL|nr:hypothetical protein Anapl_03531 [Anas platyrhynchos]